MRNQKNTKTGWKIYGKLFCAHKVNNKKRVIYICVCVCVCVALENCSKSLLKSNFSCFYFYFYIFTAVAFCKALAGNEGKKEERGSLME